MQDSNGNVYFCVDAYLNLCMHVCMYVCVVCVYVCVVGMLGGGRHVDLGMLFRSDKFD